ncbi:glycosyltransferase family 4 protein [candidate division KSB1 bacterium]|nr:glycosyltransferase family 4 protein [candidate division KSB1 bacterium]
MSEIKILHLISSSGFYGAENVIIELTKSSQINYFETVIGVFNNINNPNTEIAEEAKLNNLNVTIFLCQGRFDLRTILSIRKFIKVNNIKIVHSHGYKSNFYALMATMFTKVQKITTCHLWTEGSFKNRIYEAMDRFWVTRFDKIVTVSDKLKDQVLKTTVSSNKVTTIYNGIDLNRFNHPFKNSNLRKEFNIKKSTKVIGTIGRLTEQKGHLFLLESARQILKDFPDTGFLFVGDGHLRQVLQNKIDELDLHNHVIFTGIRKDIPEILAMIDLFVLPSLDEGFPMILLEAMAAQKPVIATNVGDVSSVLINRKTGILIPPDDRTQLINAVTELLSDKKLANELAHQGYLKVKENYSSQRMAEKYAEIYKDCFSFVGKISSPE